MNKLIDIATQYRNMGLSVIATDALKQSIGKWKIFQNELPNLQQLSEMFHHRSAQGIAIVTGKASGNLEALDIDCKNYLQGDLFVRLFNTIKTQDQELSNKLIIARSRSGGYHFYYRCAEVEPNQALARRPTTEQELLLNPKEKVRVLIETRGTGGYVVVPPSPGYTFQQYDFTRITEISISERQTLLAAARSFNQHQEQKIEWRPPKIRPVGTLSPLDDYNLRGDVIGLLQKHGWIVTGRSKERTYLRRPGNTDKRSSANFNHDLNYFYVFSTSSKEFKDRTPYLPYAVYAALECNGNFTEAKRRLAKEGYGQQTVHKNIKARSYSR